MRLRKFFMVIMLAAVAFTSCDNFLSDNLGFRKLLEEEVHDSTATVLNVKVQALPGQGNAYASTDTVKLDVSFQVSFEVDSSYGVFNYWKAYANYEKENQKELTEEDILFSKATSLTTEIKILKAYEEIRIIPYCTRHPQINVVMPSGLVNPGSLTPLGPQTIEVGKEYTITMQTSTDYGFTGWKIYAMEGDKEAELKIDEEYTAIEYEPEVSESSKNLGATKASIAIRVAKPLTKSIYIEPILYEYPDVIVQFPKAYQDFPDNIGTLSPAGTKKMRTGSEYTVKLVTRPAYGFRGWRIYSVVDGAQVDLFTNSALTEAGKSILLAVEGETTVSKGGASEGATTTSISVELKKVPDTAIYIEPEVYPYSGLMIMNYLNTSDTYDENAILTPGHGTNRNIIVGEEYTVKIKTSTAYGFNGWKIFELSNGTEKPLEKGTDYITTFDDSETAEANSSGIITVSTTFSFKREFDNPVYIVPNVYKYPRLFVSLGTKYASLTQTELAKIGSISPETGELGRAIVSGSENKITLKTTESYGFTGWKFSTESGTNLGTEYYDVISNDSVYSSNGTTATMVVVFDRSLTGNVYIEPILSNYPEAYIQLSNSAAGSITPAGLQKIMLDRDYTISLQTHSEYGFSGWKFYDSSAQNGTRTEFPVYIDGGDNSHVNTSGTYIYMTSNSNPDTTKDIVKNASLIVYNTIKDTSSSGGSVKASAYIRMTKKIDFICIEGNVVTNPIINFATPKYNGDEAGSITPLGSTRQSSDNEFTVNVRLNDLYSFDGWQLSSGGTFHTLTDYFEIKSQNINANKSEVTAVLKIKDGKNVDGFTISAKTKIRPQVRDTEPASNATGVVRTPAIKIAFTKPISDTAVSLLDQRYKTFFKIESRTSMTASTSTDVITKFNAPTLSSDKMVVTFDFNNKTNETYWLNSKGYITVTVKNILVDKDGVMLGKDYVFSFTTGTSGDSEGPIISSATLTSGAKELTAASSTQAYWGDWEPPNAGAEASHVYADSFRTEGSSDDKFTAKITASDTNTGNTGISGYYVIQRLMYVHKGGRLPNTSKLADSDMTFFSKDGVWKGLSGCMPADYEKEISLTLKSGSTDTFEAFALSSDFKDSGNKLVDGIYMLELTAKDGLGNKSGNPARFFIVRDTTAPSAAENEGKLYISDGGVLVDGTRYFGDKDGFKKVTVGFNVNDALTDFGTQGQPWTASKNLMWDAELSSSDESFVSVTGATWKGYESLATTSKTFTIPSSYLSGNDKKLYVWFNLKDDLGHESIPAWATNAVVYIDVQKPTFPEIVGNNAVFDFSNNKISLSSSSEKVKFVATDPSAANCSSGCKIVVKQNGTTAISADSSGAYSLSKDQSYQIYSEDGFGNTSEKRTFAAVTDTTPPTITINSLAERYEVTNYMYRQEGAGTVYTGNNYTAGNFGGTSTDYNIDTSGYTSGNVKLEFTINEADGFLESNSIRITGMEISSYKIGSNDTVNLSTPTNIIPTPVGFECKNVPFIVEGKLTGCDFDGSDDGLKTITVSASDGVNSATEESTITLKTTKPEFEVVGGTGMIYNQENDTWFTSTKATPLGFSSSEHNYKFPFTLNSSDSSIFYYYITVPWDKAVINYGIGSHSIPTWKAESWFSVKPKSISASEGFNIHFSSDCTITIRCYDLYGNYTEKSIKVSSDSIPPTLTPAPDNISVSGTYWVKGGETAKFEVKDDGIGIKSYYFIAGENFVSGENNGVVELTGTTSGANYTYSIIDKFENKTSGSVTVKADNAAPTGSVTTAPVGIYRPSSDVEKQISGYFKNLMYTEITVTENGVGLKENGILILNQTIEKYSLDGGSTWKTDAANTHEIPVSAGTKYSNKKICMYLKATSATNSVIVIVEDRVGNKKVLNAGSLTYDGTGPAMGNTTTYISTTNRSSNLQATTAQITFTRTNALADTTITIYNNDAGCGISEITFQPKLSIEPEKTFKMINGNEVMTSCKYTLPGKSNYQLRLVISDLLGNTITPSLTLNSNLDIQGFENGKPTDSSWSGDWEVVHSYTEMFRGSYALKSKKISDSQTSTQTLTVTCSNVSFWYKVSSEQNYDYLKFSVDGTVVIGGDKKLSGIIDWTQCNWEGTSGTHVLKWEYIKDNSQSENDDCAWIDDLYIN